MRHVAGFTLLEVLIAVLVLALGLTGGAAMQLHAMRTRHESALLSASLQIAVAMADRMRANAGQVPAIYLGVDYDAHAGAMPEAPGNLCRAESCNATDIARLDIHELVRQVHAALPAGRARICRDAQPYAAGRLRWECSGGADDPVVVKIGWRGKRADGTPAGEGRRGALPGVAIAVAGVQP
ncbi:type IV pilus modification protein PilV [Pseudoduganella umbonata]|uniref:Type IV pilus assembly protein PilV n=1 Tax=Pseudoduganella umbonata TaxID=864828 RepID=A0A4P8HYD3_9BURK|nr:type IV pilus modification protein PilV [Pseudoduganella umbonata]MBB3224137.1 type IV pilus assembly protein PilV [Pseudoduganella umbonata]QCP14002.1 type IV pilus modification protein PilV [Pseudoduganella umbonata]